MRTGNFIKYKDYLMAVIATDDESKQATLLCLDNHRVAKLPLDAKVTVLKEDGCTSLVKAIYSDMDYYRKMNK